MYDIQCMHMYSTNDHIPAIDAGKQASVAERILCFENSIYGYVISSYILFSFFHQTFPLMRPKC